MARKKKNQQVETSQSEPVVVPVDMTLPNPAPPPTIVEPVVPPVTPKCSGCQWANADTDVKGLPMNTDHNGYICTLNPPVFVGLDYSMKTQRGTQSGFAYPKVLGEQSCSHFKARKVEA